MLCRCRHARRERTGRPVLVLAKVGISRVYSAAETKDVNTAYMLGAAYQNSTKGARGCRGVAAAAAAAGRRRRQW